MTMILPETSSKSTMVTKQSRMPTFKISNFTNPVRRTLSVENVMKLCECSVVRSKLNQTPFSDCKSVMPWDGRETGRGTSVWVWSVTSRCEHPDDFSDGQRVSVWMRKSQRSVTVVDVVRPGSQCTEFAVK